jgi:hypothetical protein
MIPNVLFRIGSSLFWNHTFEHVAPSITGARPSPPAAHLQVRSPALTILEKNSSILVGPALQSTAGPSPRLSRSKF